MDRSACDLQALPRPRLASLVTRGLSALCAQFAKQHKQLFECAKNDLRAGAGLLARHPRQMADVDLAYLRAAARQSRHQLRRDHRTVRLELHAVEQVAPEQLESAIDVVD